MICYKDTILEDYSIDPVTAIITNSKGEIQKTYIHRGRLYFKGHKVHEWQVHTHIGYKRGFDIHHIDENKLNNSLSNLVYLSRSEHMKIHSENRSEETKMKMSEAKKGKNHPFYGQHHSEEIKRKISEAQKGKNHPLFGTKFKWINNGIEQRRCPLDEDIPKGFVRGMLKWKNK